MARMDVVRLQRLPDSGNDGNAAGNRRLKRDGAAVGARQVKQLLAVGCQKSLVCRNNVFVSVERFFYQSFSVRRAANQLDNDGDFRVVDNIVCGIGENFHRLGNAAVARRVEVGDARQNQVNAAALSHELLLVEQKFRNSRPDGSESNQSNFNGFFFSCHYFVQFKFTNKPLIMNQYSR